MMPPRAPFGDDGAGRLAAANNRLRQSLGSSRRLLVPIGILGTTILVGGYWALHHGQRPEPHSTDLAAPKLDAPAGGSHRTPLIDRATDAVEADDAQRARSAGASYAGSVRGADLATPHAPELGDLPGGGKAGANAPPAPVVPASARSAAPPRSSPPPTAPSASATRSAAPQTAETGSMTAPRRAAQDLPVGAQAELIAAWSGHRPRLDMVMPSRQDATSEKRSDDLTTSPEGTPTSGGAAAEPHSKASASRNAAATKTLILQAGRGVYGHAVITSNSDLGEKVLVEIDSGPLVHDRVSGTFQMKNDRLLIQFNKLMIEDSPPIAISAYAVSPDTAETGVASEVDQHLLSRVLLETAAGFVAGLGSSVQNSNTTSTSSGLGVSSFTHLTLPQEMLVGAGQGAQAFSQSLQKVIPQQSTVKLDKDDPVGIVFEDAVYAP